MFKSEKTKKTVKRLLSVSLTLLLMLTFTFLGSGSSIWAEDDPGQGAVLTAKGAPDVPYLLHITTPDVPSVYNGEEQTYTIKAGAETIDTTNPFQETVSFIMEKLSSFFYITASAEDEGVEFKCDGETYVLHNCEVTATGKEVGQSYQFELISEPTVTLEGQDVTDWFDIETDLGCLIIDPVQVTIVADNKEKTADEEDPEFTCQIYGIPEGEEIDITYEREPGNELGEEYTITPVVDKSAYTNYKIEIETGTLKIVEPEPEPEPEAEPEPGPEVAPVAPVKPDKPDKPADPEPSKVADTGSTPAGTSGLKTGDDSALGLWMGLLLGSAGAITGLYVKRRRDLTK